MRILVAEDDLDTSMLYKKALERRNHNVILTSSGTACIRNYLENFPDIATLPNPTLSSATTSETSKISSSPRHGKLNSRDIQIRKAASATTPVGSYDVVILDYRLPGINGMKVAKEIFEINPRQRIVFASAYVEETLQESAKQLKRIVELIKKPFRLSELIDKLEDKELYEELKALDVDVDRIRAARPSHELLLDLLERLARIQTAKTSPSY
jgi:CheY-like chemotaxis protein